LGTSNLTGTPKEISVPISRRDDLLRDSQRIGHGVIVGEPGWEARLEANKRTFLSDFTSRGLLSILYPTDMSPEEFVDALYLNAGVVPTAAERNAALGEFGVTGVTIDSSARGRVLRRIIEDPTVDATQFNRAFVLMQYIGYLRRNPNDPQDTDHSGYDFWLKKLDQFNGDFVKAEMVRAFLISIEYRSGFGNP